MDGQTHTHAHTRFTPNHCHDLHSRTVCKSRLQSSAFSSLMDRSVLNVHFDGWAKCSCNKCHFLPLFWLKPHLHTMHAMKPRQMLLRLLATIFVLFRVFAPSLLWVSMIYFPFLYIPVCLLRLATQIDVSTTLGVFCGWFGAAESHVT